MSSVDSNEYSGSYTWNIDENAFKTFVECKPTEGQTADTFTIQKLPFTLEAFPNGDNDSNHGSVMLYCTLLSIPDNYKQIITNVRLYSKETATSFTSIVIFTSERNSAGWSSNALTTNELINNGSNTFCFGCDINIIKIIGEDNKLIASNTKH
eukprot:358598_1